MHRALLRSRENGFSGAPLLAATGAGETVLDLDGRLFDAQEWLPGRPLAGDPTPGIPTPNAVHPLRPEILSSLTTAIARFHRSTAGLKPEREAEKAPLSTQLAEVAPDEGEREALLAGVESRARNRGRRVALRWLELLPAAVGLARTNLQEHPAGALDTSSLCHGDLWASHTYFEGPRFVGLTDFEELRFGSSASDLAHLVLHFNGWASRKVVLGAYERVNPLGEKVVAMLPTAAVVDLAWEGSWSLSRLYTEKERPAPAQRRSHEINLSTLLGSLETIVAGTGRF